MGDLVSQKPAELHDRDNPRSILNLVPPVVRDALERIPGDFLDMDETDLERERGQPFTVLDRRLRTAFWMEYSRAQDSGSQINVSNVYNGICTRTHFYNSILKTPSRISYVLLPPSDYRVSTEEALVFGIDSLRDCLDIAVRSFKTLPDPKMLDSITKVVAMLDVRVKGAVVQKIQQHNINQSLGEGKSKSETPQSMEELDQKLSVLQAKFAASSPVKSKVLIEDAEVIGPAVPPSITQE